MKDKKIVGKIIDGVLNVLIVLFALFLLISMYTAIQVKIFKNEYSNFFGYSMFEVQTGSMHGAIEASDWIIIKGTKDVNTGDIITYKRGDDYITHRVIESYRGTYVTKGDANMTADDPIDQNQIVGKVVKVLHGFGILKKTIFNPVVILLLMITLYLFNLTFKQGKSKFDIKIEELLKKGKEYLISLFNKSKNKANETISKVKNEEPKKDKVIKKEEIVEETKPKEEVEEIEELDLDFNEEELSKTSLFRVVKVKDKPGEVAEIVQEEIKPTENIEEIEDITDEDELSKTQLFRFISVKPEVNIEEEKKEEKEEELSKTSLYKVISVNEKPLEAVAEEKQEEEIPIKDDKTITLEAYKTEEVSVDKVITKDYIVELLKSKKAKNIVDKAFLIKKSVYNEIMDVVLKPCKSYIYKSNMRGDFIKYYITYKYLSLDSDRKNIKKLIKDYGDDLVKKYIRDENKVNTINSYIDSLNLIANIEDKTNCNYEKEIKGIFNYDVDTIKHMANDVSLIVRYANEFLNDILLQLDTKTFEVKYSKFNNQKNLYGVILNHNISFNKVYSDYIVDKTYTKGVISEDKLAVLLSMLSCRVVFDMTRFNYISKYFVYLPESLYSKDRKIDKIVSIIDNDYAKNHICILTNVSNMLKNKDDIKRLRKRGYSFACIFDKEINYKNDDMGYIYLNDYYFVDSDSDINVVCKGLPKEIVDKVIVDNINKKVGDYGGE